MHYYSFSHMPTVPIVGGPYIIWPMGLPEKAASVYRATLKTTRPVLVIGSERHRWRNCVTR